MAGDKRHVDPDKYYMLTNRTEDGTFYFRPDEECTRIIGGLLAKWADHHDVQLVCFVFMSNHFHIIARFPDRNMAEFMRDLQRGLVDRINDIRGDRDGSMFPESYDDEALLDANVLLDKISYVANNPVKAGLVLEAGKWPGITSQDCHTEGGKFSGEWHDSNHWHNLKRQEADHDREEALVEYTVDLHIPECLHGETRAQRRQTIVSAIEADRKRLRRERTIERREVVGKDEVKKVPWRRTQPLEEPGEEESPLCVATQKEAIESYREQREGIDAHYEAALDQMYDPDKTARFPVGTHKPGLNRPVEPPS